jgi:hypothetical protein
VSLADVLDYRGVFILLRVIYIKSFNSLIDLVVRIALGFIESPRKTSATERAMDCSLKVGILEPFPRRRLP